MAANHEQDTYGRRRRASSETARIKKDTVRWSKSDGKCEHQRGQLAQGQFFGERALRTKEKREATVSIDTQQGGGAAVDDGDSFEELLGPVLEMVDELIKEYRRPTVTTASRRTRAGDGGRAQREQAHLVAAASQIEDAAYVDFYKALTSDGDEPLGHVHFKAEGQIEFDSILCIQPTPNLF